MEFALEAIMDASTTIAERVRRLRLEVAEVARSANRNPAEITIVAVSKVHTRDFLLAAYDAGMRDFGENHVQEAIPKLEGLPSDAQRHFIGHIQTNKAKAIAGTFDLVQSVDRLEAGLALAKAGRALGKPVRALLQLNISATDRFGMLPEQAPELSARLRDEGLDVAGTMAMAPFTPDQRTVRDAFLRAADAHARIGGAILSLGMSADWPVALECGSTMIRIGTAIFGPRPQKGGTL
ncbi:MAG: YggS family pyridoxal phosphate-dependent enzyme [Vulcanimicrobiaceae bacterium]